MTVLKIAALATVLVFAQGRMAAAEPADAHGGPASQGAVTGDAPPVPAAFVPIRALIDSWVAKGYYPGASLVVVQDGHPLVDLRFGNHTGTTVEFIASAGKWLAAATIMALVDQGKLHLDDPASKLLPELGPQLGRATLRQMLAHTSGYPPYQPKDRHPDDYQTLAESVAQLAPLAPLTEPGSHWLYGGLALQAAGRMAEVATGEQWEALFQRLVAVPLGMTDTHFSPLDPGYGHTPLLGGGARSSVRDYARFLTMLLADGVTPDGHRVLSPVAIAAMQADQVGTAEMQVENFIWQTRGKKFTGIYGLGEWREVVDGDRAVVVSSPSWAGTYPWIDHRHHLFGFFLAHVNVEVATKDHFNSMTSSAKLVDLVAAAVAQEPGK